MWSWDERVGNHRTNQRNISEKLLQNPVRIEPQNYGFLTDVASENSYNLVHFRLAEWMQGSEWRDL